MRANTNPPRRLDVVQFKQTNYLEGRKLCRSKGFDQIPLLMADELIMNEDPRITSDCLVKELVAYPEKDGRFKTGSDIISELNKLILLWSDLVKICAPSDFAELLKIALLITPSDCKDNFTEIWKGKRIVRPQNIEIVRGFLQESDFGILDKKTGLIVEGDPYLEERYLERDCTNGPNLGPITHGLDYYECFGDRRREVDSSISLYTVAGTVGIRELQTSDE